MAFVLTGKDDWRQWSRTAIEGALEATGSMVVEKIRFTTDILVSSRMDTVKAKAASAMGCQIITYQELHAAIVTGDINSNQYMSGAGDEDGDIDAPMPPKVIDMTLMHDLPGWGSF